MYSQKYHKFERLYNHKFGFHINGPSQAAYDMAVRLKPRVIKTLEHNVDAMRKLREAIPDVFLIGRLFDPVQDFGNHPAGDAMADRIRRARQRGRAFAEKILRLEVNRIHYQGQPLFNAWESFNEIFPESVDADTQRVYDEFQVAFGQRLLVEGFEPVGMNFATGNFRGWHFVENFAGTLETYKYLGFHEYDWPRLDRLHVLGLNAEDSRENIRDRLPGVGENRGNDGMWLCLRYRRIVHEGVRRKYGDKHVCIITECGMTQGVQQGEDVGPWFEANTLPRHYSDSALPSPIDVEDYWRQLLWYNEELLQDEYLMGACLFVTGAVAQWWSFEHLGPIMDRLAAFQDEAPSKTADSRSQSAEGTTRSSQAPGSAAISFSLATLDADPAPAGPEVEIQTSGTEADRPALPGAGWAVELESGAGLPLLVGDIGLAGESITIVRPNGIEVRVVSGSKPEYGAGGFEIYAHESGNYRIRFLDQEFDLPLPGRFTRAIFRER